MRKVRIREDKNIKTRRMVDLNMAYVIKQGIQGLSSEIKK
jgi:hypothetical protein